MANLFVNIISRFDPSGTKEAQKGTTDLVKSLKAAAAGLAANEIVQFGRQSLELAREQAKAEAQVAASIASTGNAAGVSLRQLKAHASALQEVTNFGDEATLAAQSQLLTFTKIGSETFPRATEAVLDLATKMDGDLKGAVVQIGKALNDPIAGMTALSRSGIQFTEQQKEQIQTLQESGRLLEAQNIILEELEAQFGGSAKAAREADGGIIAMSNSFGDLKEQVGFLIADLNQATQTTENLIQVFNALGSGIADLRVDLGLTEDVSVQIQAVEGQIRSLEKARDEIASGGGQSIISRILGTASDDTSHIDAELERLRAELLDLNRQSDEEEAQAQAEASQKKINTESETNDELIDLRRSLAEELLDIQEASAGELAENADKLAEELVDAESDAQDRITDIVERGNKDRLKLQDRFRKDLERLEKNTTTSIEKHKKDEDKRVERLQEESQKDEKRTRRRKQIDALADERLFQFELRQLAAEGEGLAIKEALERRAIEEEIAQEKAEFEKEVESEKKEDQIATIRDEGRERRAQMQMDAQERAALLREQHGEELKELAAKVQEDAQIERESLVERKADLDQYYAERAEKIREGEEEGIAEVAEGIAEIEDITLTGLSSLVSLASEFGASAGENFASGLETGFNRKQKISDLLGGLSSGGRRSASGGQSAGAPPLVGAFGGSPDMFQSGGVVGGAPGAPRLIVAHGGEEIANPNEGQSLTVGGETFAVREASRMKSAIERLINSRIQLFADQLAEEIG